MEGTLCYAHGYLPHGCSACARLWQDIARTDGPAWADKVVWPNLGPISDEEAEEQLQGLKSMSRLFGW